MFWQLPELLRTTPELTSFTRAWAGSLARWDVTEGMNEYQSSVWVNGKLNHNGQHDRDLNRKLKRRQVEDFFSETDRVSSQTGRNCPQASDERIPLSIPLGFVVQPNERFAYGSGNGDFETGVLWWCHFAAQAGCRVSSSAMTSSSRRSPFGFAYSASCSAVSCVLYKLA